jgi:acetyltransferase (GNAT) family protein
MSDAITRRWIDGHSATKEEWNAIEEFLAARGWMSLSRETTPRIRVAERDGKIVGFMVLQMTPQCGPLYVTPKERGTGLAEELADDMFDFLVEAKARGWFVVADSPHVPKMCEARKMRKLESPIYTTEVL